MEAGFKRAMGWCSGGATASWSSPASMAVSGGCAHARRGFHSFYRQPVRGRAFLGHIATPRGEGFGPGALDGNADGDGVRAVWRMAGVVAALRAGRGAWRTPVQPASEDRGRNRGCAGPHGQKPAGFAVIGVRCAVRESEATVSGNFVIRSNFQIQLCNFNLSPPRWAQMKNY